ncbi:uncharacterized protein LOC117649455 [Thrips palmi]|uniref:Uncharacterized protein LOC117649455 n=1 Tax=Thrips palmi TaxID=161013 RepID=A0A6P8ZSE8_THRPL|nr:uncharacterized protein LOC117649455 [Thrips palmi]
MARLSVLVVTLLGMAACAAAWPDFNTQHNKLIVTFDIMPDPFHKRSFFDMPRTLEEAAKDGWKLSQYRQHDQTVIHCRGKDYRVCLLFDESGSVAGIRVSVSQWEMNKIGFDLEYIPEWELNFDPLASDWVYSATVFFQAKHELLSGGRNLTKQDLTAPNGLYILQTDQVGLEMNRLHVPNQQSEALSAGFTEQACFFGMGKHYFLDMQKDSKCIEHRPFFTLYGPKSHELNGFGFVQYGKIRKEKNMRNWFESPTAQVAMTIAPNSPPCLGEWVNKYGLFTLHVYFVPHPFFTFC